MRTPASTGAASSTGSRAGPPPSSSRTRVRGGSRGRYGRGRGGRIPGYSPEDGVKCITAGQYCAAGGELDYWFPCNTDKANVTSVPWPPSHIPTLHPVIFPLPESPGEEGVGRG